MHKRAISFLLSAVILLGMLCGVAPKARAESNFVTSDACVAMIKDMEGFSKYPYYDNGQYTVGYGTTCPPEEYERYNTYGITEEEAEESLRNYLQIFESSLNSFINKNDLTINQGQFDALLSFTYNVGNAWTRSESTFRTAVLEGATGNDFIFAIARWCTASGKVLKSLIERRLIEANMYLNGVYADSVPSNYKYVVFNDNHSSAANDVRVQAYDANVGDSIRSTPTAEGYTFLGWYTEPSGGTRVTKLDASVRATTLYAHWAEGNVAVPNEPEEDVEPTQPEQEPDSLIDTGVVNTERLNVRSAAGTWNALVGYVYEGDVVEIYDIANLNGVVWGRISGGWVSLDYVTLSSAPKDDVPEEPTEAPEEPTEAPTEPTEPEKTEDTVIAKGVVSVTSLNIRSEASTASAVVGSISEGTEVDIYETTEINGTVWGRIDRGWISLDHVEWGNRVIASGTVSTEKLNVRSGAGTFNALVGYFYAGDTVEIYETTAIGETTWGRTELGWISLEYVSFGMAAPELSVSNVESTGKIKLSWTAVSGAKEYIVYRATEKSGEYKRLKTTEETTHVNGTVEVGKTYYYYVVAVADDGSRSEFSNTVEGTCVLERPVVSVCNIESTGKIRIEWDEIEGAAGYEVYRSATGDGEFTLLKKVSGTRLNHTSAVAGETWYYKVKALGQISAADSAFSSVKYRTCDVARPKVTVTNIESTGKIRIDWNSVKDADGYEVYCATEQDGEFKLLKKVRSSALNHTSAREGVTYYYKVVALGPNSAADSAESAVQSGTCGLPEVELSIKLSSKGKPRLSWNRISGAEKYEVYRSVGEDGGWKLLNTVKGTAMTNISAESGVTYYYKIVAVLSGTTAESETVSITAE